MPNVDHMKAQKSWQRPVKEAMAVKFFLTLF